MPTLRQLLFLTTGLIVGSYFLISTNLLTFDTSVLSDDATFLGYESLEDDQVRLEEDRRSEYEKRHAGALEVLLWIKDKQRIVENLTGPAWDYCWIGRSASELIRRNMLSKYDPNADSELIHIAQMALNVSERIVYLCGGTCPAIVQRPTIQPLKHSVQSLEEKQVEEERHSEYEKRHAGALEVLLWIKDKQRIVENLTGPIRVNCWIASSASVLIRRNMLPKYDPVTDSELIRIAEKALNVSERMLDLCGKCPAIVQRQQIQPRRDSDQVIEPQKEVSHFAWHIQVFGIRLVFRVVNGGYIEAITGVIIGAYLMTDMSARPVIDAMPTLRWVIFAALDLFVWSIGTSIVQERIGLIISQFLATEIVFLGLRQLLTVVAIISAVRFLRNRIFKVDQSVEQTLVDLDQLLQRAKNTERHVLIRLAAGAARDDLRPIEIGATSLIQRIKNMKSVYESSVVIKVMWRGFPYKGEEVIDICERIVFLCRPASAA